MKLRLELIALVLLLVTFIAFGQGNISGGGGAVYTGTANQISISAANVLSTPQSIDTGASVQFLHIGCGVAADASYGLKCTGLVEGSDIRATSSVKVIGSIALRSPDAGTTLTLGEQFTVVSDGAIAQSPSNIVRLDTAFTDANASGLQNITGLSWTMPGSLAVIWPFHCRLVVNQNTAAVVDTIGIQDVTTAPTYIQATGVAETALTAAAFGDLGVGLTTTTATGIISFTPGATGTNLTVLIDGVINQPSGAASVIQMMIQQATAADTIIVQKGSFCSFGGTS